MKAWLPAPIFVLLLAGPGCTSGGDQPYAGYHSEVYSLDSWWLCRPDLENNLCHIDLTTVEVLPDGSHQMLVHQPAVDPDVDCFYVYPTMTWETEPGNHSDPADTQWIKEALHSQVSRFSEVCRLFVPYYRQATIGAYLSEDVQPFIDLAYFDVLDAFRHYLANFNQGRRLVLMGHSQGTQHLTRLVQREFDPDPALRKRLALGLLIGFDAYVPEGDLQGGSLANIPLCNSAGQSGCIVAFNAFSTDHPPETPGFNGAIPPRGMTTACNHPAALSGGPAHFKQAVFPRDSMLGNLKFDDQTDAPFVSYPDFFAAECTLNQNQFRYLGISAAPGQQDTRENPIPFDSFASTVTHHGRVHETGLHLLDYFFAQGDLIDLVAGLAE